MGDTKNRKTIEKLELFSFIAFSLVIYNPI